MVAHAKDDGSSSLLLCRLFVCETAGGLLYSTVPDRLVKGLAAKQLEIILADLRVM